MCFVDPEQFSEENFSPIWGNPFVQFHAEVGWPCVLAHAGVSEEDSSDAASTVMDNKCLSLLLMSSIAYVRIYMPLSVTHVPVTIAGYQIDPEFRGLRSPFSSADKILWVRSSGRIVGMACLCSSISGALSGKAKSLEMT